MAEAKEGRVALVTGAAAGIGAGIAIRLAQDGVAIGVLDLDKQRCEETITSIKNAGGRAVALGADITHRGQVRTAVARLRSGLGPVSVLVNNAAISGFAPFLEITDEQWERVIRVNLTGAFIVSQEAVPDMIEAGWGRVLKDRPADAGGFMAWG